MLRKLKLDSTNQEPLQYSESTFPVECYIDHFAHYVDRTMETHWHNGIEYMLALNSDLDITINGHFYTLHKGECAFYNLNVMHGIRASKSVEDPQSFGLFFSPLVLCDNAGSVVYQQYIHPIIYSSLNGFILKPDNPISSKIIQLLHDSKDVLFSKSSYYGYELKVLSLLCEIWRLTSIYIDNYQPVANATAQNNKSTEIAKKIIMLIHSQYTEDISIEQISSELYISRSKCFKIFKQYTQKTPIAYLMEYRLKKAGEMLLQTDKSVTEIGTACGFSSSSYFIKCFKESFGVSPAKYRK